MPRLFETYKVKTFLDAPCGDWFWMREVDLSGVTYIGADISQSLIAEIAAEHSAEGRSFQHLDVTSDPLPQADMMMCRDCLFHLSFEMRWAFYENFAKSEIPYLLSTVNYNVVNEDLNSPGWKPYNPFLAPFYMGDPLEFIQERGNEPLNPDWRVMLTHPNPESFRAMAVWDRQAVVDMLKKRKG